MAMRICPLGFPVTTRTLVFSFDDAYARYFSVALLSLVAHADPSCHCDIVVLHGGVAPRTERTLGGMVPANFTLRYFDVSGYAQDTLGDLARQVSSDQWDVSTFYDLLVPLLMPDYERVVYCDSDLVFCDDPAEFFELPFEGSQLMAARDSLALALVARPESDFLRRQATFVRDELGISDLGSYFNAGVLVFDVAAIDRDDYLDRVCQALGLPRLPTVDQDVLNYVFRGRVRLLPQRLNLQAHLMGVLEGAPAGPLLAAEYQKAAPKPAIVHYTSHRKPWNHAGVPLEEAFWECAAESPYYDAILTGHQASLQRRGQAANEAIRSVK